MKNKKQMPMKVTEEVLMAPRHRVMVDRKLDTLQFKLYVLGTLERELSLNISDPRLNNNRGIHTITEYSGDILSFQSAIRGLFGVNIPQYVANEFSVLYLVIKSRLPAKEITPKNFYTKTRKGIMRRTKTHHVISSIKDILEWKEAPDWLLEKTLYPKNIKKHPDDEGFLSACDAGETV